MHSFHLRQAQRMEYTELNVGKRKRFAVETREIMNPYYTANTLFVVFAMMIMLTAVAFNTTLDRQRKLVTRVLFLLISIAALCEWLGNALNGTPAQWIVLHKLVKYIELCSAPYLGLLCGKSLASRSVWEKGIRILLAFHVVLETVNLFTGQIWYVDAQNFYHHGPVYFVYIFFYCFGVVYYLLQGLQTFWHYQQSGGTMILLVTAFLVTGIVVAMWGGVEITWLVVAISAIMLYKFYGDILQQVDGLTELGNRWSFEDYLKRFRGTGVLLFFDVDCFKQVNDTFGHAIGDRCLCTVAQGLRAVYGTSGRCFRVGGDEFCVVLRRNLDKVEQLNAELAAWQQANTEPGQPVMEVSVGWEPFDTSEESMEEAFNRADKAMYHVKNARKTAEKTAETTQI